MKRRDPNTHEDALVKIAGVLGVKEMAFAIGLGDGRIRAAMDPDRDPLAPLNFHQCIKLDAVFNNQTGEGYPLLRAYRAQLEEQSPHRPLDPAQRITRVIREATDVVEAHTNQKPIAELEREVAEAKEELDALLADARASLGPAAQGVAAE